MEPCPTDFYCCGVSWNLAPPTPIAVASIAFLFFFCSLHVPMNDLDDRTSRHSSASLVFVTTSVFRWELVASPWLPSWMHSNGRPSQQLG
jgi:hypothetical protein